MVSYAGTSSMEVCVQIIIEDVLNKERHLAILSFLTFVALDDNGKPVQVPDVYPESKVENGSMKVRLSVYNVEKIEEKKVKIRLNFYQMHNILKNYKSRTS